MKIFGSILITIVTGTMFLSLFHMSMGMDMSGGMTDCLFMERGEVICPMDIAEHLAAWKSVFLAVAPTLILMFIVSGVVIAWATKAPHLLVRILHRPPLFLKYYKDKTHTFSSRPLQELFSSGILHPKLF
jgi:hypothetical protein